MKRDSFIFYRSFYEAINDLPEKNQLQVYKAICELSLNFEEIDLKGIGLTIFKLIKPQLEANNQRFINGQKGGQYGSLGGRPKKPQNKPQENPKETPNNNVNVNDNINDNDNIKEKVNKKKSFTKPTTEEIQEYCLERNNGINAEAFYDFYESKNWYVGKNKMQDWKACVRTWEKRNNKKNDIPSWFNKEVKEEQATDDDIKKLEERIKNRQ